MDDTFSSPIVALRELLAAPFLSRYDEIGLNTGGIRKSKKDTAWFCARIVMQAPQNAQCTLVQIIRAVQNTLYTGCSHLPEYVVSYVGIVRTLQNDYCVRIVCTAHNT